MTQTTNKLAAQWFGTSVFVPQDDGGLRYVSLRRDKITIQSHGDDLATLSWQELIDATLAYAEQRDAKKETP